MCKLRLLKACSEKDCLRALPYQTIKMEKIFQKSTKEKYDAVGCVVNLAHLTLWQPYMSILLRRWMIGMLNKTDMERCCRFNYRIFYASENVAFCFIYQVGTKHFALYVSYH